MRATQPHTCHLGSSQDHGVLTLFERSLRCLHFLRRLAARGRHLLVLASQLQLQAVDLRSKSSCIKV